ncbi:SWIM zinc finger family protein [Methanosarcina sp.]|uniref:SWIM zinc finger family protein n=1 Tax=Methanosarcina sp. TaxID=2213 RepID=UPI003BB7BEF9
MTCTCQDFLKRGGKCKHILATKYYLEVEKETPDGTYYEKVNLTYAQLRIPNIAIFRYNS